MEAAKASILADSGGARISQSAQAGAADRIVGSRFPTTAPSRPSFFFFFFFLRSRVSLLLPSLFPLLLGRVRREAQAPPRAFQRHAHAREALHPLHGQGEIISFPFFFSGLKRRPVTGEMVRVVGRGEIKSHHLSLFLLPKPAFSPTNNNTAISCTRSKTSSPPRTRSSRPSPRSTTSSTRSAAGSSARARTSRSSSRPRRPRTPSCAARWRRSPSAPRRWPSGRSSTSR